MLRTPLAGHATCKYGLALHLCDGKGGDGGDGGAALLPGFNGLPGVAGSPNGQPGDDPCAEFHWAARVDGVDKKTFAAALSALCDGSHMTFYRDFRGALTLEPDLGRVTFDLNGRSILGVDGTDARDPAKADGKSALVVNMNTWLVLTNGAFDASQPASESNRLSYVKGGDGAAGIIGIEAVPYGKGARAITPESAVTDGRIVWDATSVVVTNGVDGATADSLIALLRKRLQPEGTAELRNGFAYAYLTNDLVRTVEVPPKMGPVTFDLQGHVMTGADGEPALRVREGTQLTVVDSDPERRGNVVAGAGASCPYELSSTNGLTTTQLPYAASALDRAGVTYAAYDGKAHALRFVTAADEKVEFTGANTFVNAGTNRAAFAYRREGFEPLVAFATLEIAPWRFNTVEFVGTAVDDQPWSEAPFCPVPVISNLTLRTTLTLSNDFTCVVRADANGTAYVLATGCGNYCGTLACALVKKDPSDIGDLYQGNVPVVVTGYSGTADGKEHAVTWRWTSGDVYNNTIIFSVDGKTWSPTPPSFVTTYGRDIRVYYYAQSRYASQRTKAYTSTRWYVTVRISSAEPDEPDVPVDPAPPPAFGPSAGGRLFADNGDGTVGVTIGNAKAGVTYTVTAAKDLTFDGATTTEATAAKDGPLTVNVPRPSDESGFFKVSVRP